MSIVPFSSVSSFSDELTLGRRASGTSMSAFFDARSGKTNIFQGPENMKQLFYVRPAGIGSDDMDKFRAKKGIKFDINLEVTDPSFVEACGRFDEFTLASVFARKGELMPSKASFITSVDSLQPLYVSGRFLHKGGVSAEGKAYADTIKLKVVGDWTPYVTKIHMRTAKGGKSGSWPTVDYCEWAPRDLKTHPYGPADTRFFLWTRKDAVTGLDVYTDKVKLEDGTLRAVGPEDCKPGCLITPIFSMANVYVSEGFGVTANARALYIKPRPEAEERKDKPAAFNAESLPMLGGAMMDADEQMA